MIQVKMGNNCQNEKSAIQIFYMLESKWLSTIHLIKSLKNVGGNLNHFCLGHKLKLAAETLVFQSDQKFMYFVVKFNAKFQFWCKTRNVPKKIYAEIWPVEEITSLNSFYNINYNSGHGSTLKVCSWIFI